MNPGIRLCAKGVPGYPAGTIFTPPSKRMLPLDAPVGAPVDAPLTPASLDAPLPEALLPESLTLAPLDAPLPEALMVPVDVALLTSPLDAPLPVAFVAPVDAPLLTAPPDPDGAEAPLVLPEPVGRPLRPHAPPPPPTPTRATTLLTH